MRLDLNALNVDTVAQREWQDKQTEETSLNGKARVIQTSVLGKAVKTVVAQHDDVFICVSLDWQPVKLPEEGCSMVFFLSAEDSETGIILSPLKFVQ